MSKPAAYGKAPTPEYIDGIVGGKSAYYPGIRDGLEADITPAPAAIPAKELSYY